MNKNPLKRLFDFDQSVWCDNIERRMIRDKAFERMISEDGIRGVTSNPTIFEKAVTSSNDYDSALRELGERGLTTEEVFWGIVIRDIQDVADIFLAVYQESKGGDGFVSIEVSPLLAHDSAGTVRQAEELWKRVSKKNIMVKIPATREGLPAITETIAKGINVNVTLIFSVARYREVMGAFFLGLEKRLGEGLSITGIASVASFFVSRVDSEVDKRLEEKIKAAQTEGERAP